MPTLYTPPDVSLYKSIDYKDWFINQKRIPDVHSKEYKEFFDFHKELCLTGFMMGGVYISGFLYWHLNVWHTEVDVIDERGYIKQKYANPYLRDNEWVISSEIARAEAERKGLVILGIRRLAKSVLASSYMSLGATFDQDSQNVIAGLNAADIKLITDKMDKGLNYIPKAWRWSRIEDDWGKQVTFGMRTKGGERIPFSTVLIRNLNDGINQEAIAGTKPRRLLIDEIGKGSFLRGLQAAIPGFTTPFGWGCSPILTGTGGDILKYFDAKELMFNTEAYNFLSYPHKSDPKRVHGLFINAEYRQECKKKDTLANYLEQPDNEHLKDVEILVSDKEYALEYTRKELERIKKTGDNVAYLKEKMYFPIEVDDIFLNESTNIYRNSVEAMKAQQKRIKSVSKPGVYVELFLDGGKVKHKFSEKLPITQFPVKDQSKDAPVVIYEFPMENPPYGLYVAGIDPYRQGKSAYSDSLGCIYILKRSHNILTESYQNMIVASYTARPDDINTFNEQGRLLLKMYNARALCENDELSFINYMINKGEAPLYLEPQPIWLKDIVPNTEVKRDYGIHRSSERIRNWLRTQLKGYLEEEVYTERDEEGNIITQVLGVNRIQDEMLLEELINFNEEDNFDREIAFSLAVAMAYALDSSLGTVDSLGGDSIIEAFHNRARRKYTKRTGILGKSKSTTPAYLRKRKNTLFK